MKEWWQSKIIFIGIGIFVIVVVIILIISIKFGGAYKGGLSNFSNEIQDQEIVLKKKKQVKRLSIRKKGDTSCMDITPDGVVRQYDVCGGELTDAERLSDSKNITRLFKFVSESDITKLQDSGEDVYEITIYTETGTEVIYVSNSGTNGQAGQIVQEIILIIGDIHNPTPTPNSSGSYESPRSSSQLSSPHASGITTPSPTPTSQPESLTPFICDYVESGSKKKPYNVSNVICSNEPTTAP